MLNPIDNKMAENIVAKCYINEVIEIDPEKEVQDKEKMTKLKHCYGEADGRTAETESNLKN